jgi:glycerol uptake facilitator-like aquaporin
LRGWLQLLGGVVATVILIMIVWAGVQYIASAGDPTLVKGAKNRLINAITALLLYLMMTAILQFLIPGGIL